MRVTLDQPPIRRVLARPSPVQGFGWSAFEVAPLAHPVTLGDHGGGRLTLSNGLVTVDVDPAEGTFSVDGRGGYGRLVDGGDHGDTYNYSPPAVDVVVSEPEAVEVAAGLEGPVCATAVIRSRYRWPDRVEGTPATRVGGHDVDVVTTVELRADEHLVRVQVAFTNPSRDHRLRVHLPLPHPAETSRAECAFAVVERGLVAEGRPDETGLPTFVSRRFVSAGGLTVVHDGLLEYELVDMADGPGGRPAASELALTLLRATGMLSRLGMAYRPLPAGPMTPLAGPQMLTPVEVRYGVAVGEELDGYALADELLVPLQVVGSFGGGDRPPAGTPLTVRGAEVSAVRRQAGVIEVRVFNPGAEPTRVELPGRKGWLVDLRGLPVAPFEGDFDLRAHGIATTRLVDA